MRVWNRRSDETENAACLPDIESASISAAPSPTSSCSTRERDEIRLHKCLTTPHDPSVGALEGLEELLRAAGIDARRRRRDRARHHPGHQRADRAQRRQASA